MTRGRESINGGYPAGRTRELGLYTWALAPSPRLVDPDVTDCGLRPLEDGNQSTTRLSLTPDN
jgi:hypothetical protein